MKSAFLALLLAGVSYAQSGPAEAQYFVAGGAGFNRYAVPATSGFLTLGVRVAEGSYTYTAVSMTDTNSTMAQGILKVLVRQDGFTLGVLGDAGIASGEGAVGPAFAGGTILTFDVSRWTRTPKTWVTASVKLMKTSLTEVQPLFVFGLGKSF